ncbi:MAG: DUF5718 family protein [Succinivibrio sp.]|nr:DUF5718 family protein [Succinivibrio sp.]
MAGNFTGHLEQAGEAADFTQVKTAESNAPKALFPTYLAQGKAPTPQFLTVYPFDEYRIIFPKGEERLQMEPECALIFNVTWQGDEITALKAVSFAASNDCSIRKAGAKKISEKKNWGPSSKGLGSNQIKVDSFTQDGILQHYRIASFLVRDGVAHPYGEDSAVRDYSYVYEKLQSWLIEKLNHQQDEGPAEDVHAYLLSAGKPQQIMVSIGATRYTEFGEHNFLKQGDKTVVVLYPEDVYTQEDIQHRAQSDNLEEDDISVLIQEVVVG